jgi:hypothetical protein
MVVQRMFTSQWRVPLPQMRRAHAAFAKQSLACYTGSAAYQGPQCVSAFSGGKM